MKLSDRPAEKVWDEYMEKIAATDYGVEVSNDPSAMVERKRLIAEMRVKLHDLGVEGY